MLCSTRVLPRRVRRNATLIRTRRSGQSGEKYRAQDRPRRGRQPAESPAVDPVRQRNRRTLARRHRRIGRRGKVSVVVINASVSPVQQRNLERGLGCKVIDRTGLILEIFGARAPDEGRHASGRTGGADLPAKPAGAVLDPPGAATRRVRLHGRSRRDPDRDRPSSDRRTHHAAKARSGRDKPHPQHPAPGPQACAVSRRCPGRLYQCREIDTVQSPDTIRGDGQGPAVRPRWTRHCGL